MGVVQKGASGVGPFHGDESKAGRGLTHQKILGITKQSVHVSWGRIDPPEDRQGRPEEWPHRAFLIPKGNRVIAFRRRFPKELTCSAALKGRS